MALSSVLRGLAAFGASIVITRALTTDDRGVYGFITTTAWLLTMLAGLGVGSALTWAKASGVAQVPSLYRATWLVSLPAGALAAGVFAIVYVIQPGRVFDGVTTEAALLIAAVVVPLVLISNWTVLAYLEDRVVEMAAVAALSATVALAGLLLMAAVDELHITSALAIWTTSALLPLAFLLRTGRLGGALGSRRIAKAILRFGLRANVATIALILTWRLDVVLVKEIRGATQVAYYVVAVGIAEIILQVAVAFRVALTPRQGSQEGRRGLPATICAATRLTVSLGAVGAAALVALAGPLIVALYGERYGTSAQALAALAPGVVALVAQGPLVDYLLAEGEVAWVTRITASGLVLNVVLNVLFLERYGFVVAAAASATTYIATFAACLIAFSHHTAIPARVLLAPRSDDFRRLGRT